MFEHFSELFFFLDLAAFLAVIGLHLVKKTTHLIGLYAIQSFAVAALLFSFGIVEGEPSLLWIGVLTLAIKAFAAPIFFSRLMKRFGAQFATNNYLSMPITLAVLMGLVMISYSQIFQPLNALLPEAVGSISFNFAIVFIAMFLMINRRGVFAQMIGILSLENGIVLLAALIGIQQPLALEIGIIFDIVVWIAIGSAFIGMIHRQFGSLDTKELRHLTEED